MSLPQIMNIFRKSCAVPIAFGIVVLGIFLFATKKINGACFAVFLVCGVLVMCISYALEEAAKNIQNAATLNLKTAEMGNVSPLLLGMGQNKPQASKLDLLIKIIAFATAIIALVTLLLGKMHFGH